MRNVGTKGQNPLAFITHTHKGQKMTHAQLCRSFDLYHGIGLVYGHDRDGLCFSMYLRHGHDLAQCPKHLIYSWAD